MPPDWLNQLFSLLWCFLGAFSAAIAGCEFAERRMRLAIFFALTSGFCIWSAIRWFVMQE